MTATLRLVPLDDIVVFPNMNLTLAIDVGTDDHILLVPRHGTEFASVGTIVEVTDRATLSGGAAAVSPIGGLKQKVLAAHAAGLTEVILPERNRHDLENVPKAVRDEMTFHPVMTIREVLELALEPLDSDVALPTM